MARRKKRTKNPIEQYDHKDKQWLNNPPVGLLVAYTKRSKY